MSAKAPSVIQDTITRIHRYSENSQGLKGIFDFDNTVTKILNCGEIFYVFLITEESLCSYSENSSRLERYLLTLIIRLRKD